MLGSLVHSARNASQSQGSEALRSQLLDGTLWALAREQLGARMAPLTKAGFRPGPVCCLRHDLQPGALCAKLCCAWPGGAVCTGKAPPEILRFLPEGSALSLRDRSAQNQTLLGTRVAAQQSVAKSQCLEPTGSIKKLEHILHCQPWARNGTRRNGGTTRLMLVSRPQAETRVTLVSA